MAVNDMMSVKSHGDKTGSAHGMPGRDAVCSGSQIGGWVWTRQARQASVTRVTS